MTRDTDLIRRGDAMDLRDELADVIGARPLSSIHSALSEYRKAIRALPAHPVQEPPSPGVTVGATGPERIWAWEINNDAVPPNGYYAIAEVDDSVEYIRADLASTCAKNAQVAPAPVVPAEGLDAHRYALHLATALRERLFPDNTGWRPLDTLLGLLTQIDNMTTAIAPPVVARVTGWQPIETAPKDGVTEVLMYDPDLGMAVWPSSSSPWPNVTHWMPLPEPPAALLPAGEGEE